MKGLRAIADALTRLALVLVIVVSTTLNARADALDGIEACFKTAAAPEMSAMIAAKLADVHFVSCSSQIASGDLVMIGIAAALTALAIGGQITSEQDCNDKINAVIGMVLAKVLLGSDAIKSVLGKDTVEMLQEYVQGNGASLLSQIPALSVVFDEMSCGCAVAGTSLEVKQQMVDLYNNAKACSSFVGDVGEAFVDGLESGIDAAGNLLSDATCILTLGLFLCDDDSDTAEGEDAQPLPVPPPCIGAMTPKKAYAHGTCSCSAPKGKILSADKQSISCVTCPAGQGRDKNGFCAACPPGMKVGQDTYGHCSIPYTCPAGTHYNDTNTGCTKDCADGSVLVNGACQTCGANERPEYVNTGTSAGKCVSCEPGYYAYAGEGICYNSCSSWQKWNGTACENRCPQGTKPNTGEFGGDCLACGEGTETSPAGDTCTACPPTSTWTPLANGGGRCVCPKGTAESGGACQQCASGATWSSDATGEHCTTPPGAFPCGQGQKRDATGMCVTDCGPAAINDPGNKNKCIKCDKGELAFGGKCVDMKLDKTPKPNGQLKPNGAVTAYCPAGSRINAAGNGCEKDPAAACTKMGPNYIVSKTSRDGCKKCPMGKVANLSRTGCIVGLGRLQTQPGTAEPPPHIDIPATRAPMPAPHPNTTGVIK